MRSIKAKIWIANVILVFIIIILLWFFQIVFLDKFYIAFEVNKAIKQADEITSQIESTNSLNEDSITDIMSEWESYIYKKQLSIEILNTDNTVIYKASYSSIDMSKAEATGKAFHEVYLMGLEGQEEKKVITHPIYDMDFLVTDVPIIISQKVEGVMIISMPMTSVKDTAEILKKQLGIMTIIVLLLACIMAFNISKLFAEPISKLSQQAEAYATGDYKSRILHPNNDEIGKLAGIMNKMGEELQRNEVLQKELIANVSHELRTPLTLIRGYAEAIRDITGDQPEKRAKQLEIIIVEAKRLGNMVEDVLDLSSLQAGAVTMEIKPFSIQDLLVELKEHFELEQSGRHLELSGVLEFNNNLLGDVERIQQVFYNLVGNAFRHVGEDHKVIVAIIDVDDQKVRLEVKDHGEGIAQEDIDHVFDRYYRGKRKNGKKRDGTGLGLAIVKSILEMHQSAYGVNSILGEGTTFWFELKKEFQE